jgi:hypothetical protein
LIVFLIFFHRKAKRAALASIAKARIKVCFVFFERGCVCGSGGIWRAALLKGAPG